MILKNIILPLGIIVFIIGIAFADSTHPSGIIIDNTFCDKKELSGPLFKLTEHEGKQFGNNLFYSFERFNLHQNETAQFAITNPISRIISRVTGGESSWINGTIQSLTPDVDFYFMNPNGIMFGPHASLDINGSFYASTAHYLRFEDNSLFNTLTHIDNSQELSVSSPTSFGFLNQPIGSILISGKGMLPIDDTSLTGLSVLPGKTLSLVGGTITFDSGSWKENPITNQILELPLLKAEKGRISLISLADSGEYPIDNSPENNDSLLFGKIDIQNHALIQTSGDGPGELYIHAGEFIIKDSRIESITTGDANGGSVQLVTEKISISQSEINCSIFGNGNGSKLSIKTNQSLEIINNSSIYANAYGKGSGVSLLFDIGQDLSIQHSAIFTKTYDDRMGGTISIHVGNDFELNHGKIYSDHWSTQTGTMMNITVQDIMTVTNQSIIQARGKNINSGPAGHISIGTHQFILSDLSWINSDTYGINPGGNIIIQGNQSDAAYAIELDNSYIFAGTVESGEIAGDSGQISLKANTISLRNGASINTESSGAGKGGDVYIQATDRFTMSGKNNMDVYSTIQTSTLSPFEFAGTAGTISIQAKTVSVESYCSILATTTGPGQGGTILMAQDYLTLAPYAKISSASLSLNNGGHAGVIMIGKTIQSNPDGSFSIDTPSDTIQLNGPASISTESIGQGHAGNIVIQTKTLHLNQGASISSASKYEHAYIVSSIQQRDNLLVQKGDVVFITHADDNTSHRYIFSGNEWIPFNKWYHVQTIQERDALDIQAGDLITVSDPLFTQSDHFIYNGTNYLKFIEDYHVQTYTEFQTIIHDNSLGNGDMVHIQDMGNGESATFVQINQTWIKINNQLPNQLTLEDFYEYVQAVPTYSVGDMITIKRDDTNKPTRFIYTGQEWHLFNQNHTISDLTERKQLIQSYAIIPGDQIIYTNPVDSKQTIYIYQGGFNSSSERNFLELSVHQILSNDQKELLSSRYNIQTGHTVYVKDKIQPYVFMDNQWISLNHEQTIQNFEERSLMHLLKPGDMALITSDASTIDESWIYDGASWLIAGRLFDLSDKTDLSNITAQIGDMARIENQKGVLSQSLIFNGTNWISTIQSGHAGEISIQAEHLVTLNQESMISTESHGEGHAGSIQIWGGSIQLGQGATISSACLSKGNSGNSGVIHLVSEQDIQLKDNQTKITTSNHGAGHAGNITIQSNHLLLMNHAQIASENQAYYNGGVAGQISLQINQDIHLFNQSAMTTETHHTRYLLPEKDKQNGRIAIQAQHVINASNSQVTTSVHSGAGNGGDIHIDPKMMILNKSKIIANAYEGRGGNINIVSDQLISSVDSIIDASSQKGIDGTVTILSPEIDASKGIISLPSRFLDASRWVTNVCTKRDANKSNRLTIQDREALLLPSDDLLPVPFSFIAAMWLEIAQSELFKDNASQTSQPNTNPQALNQFNRAIEQYQEGNFIDSLRLFQTMIHQKLYSDWSDFIYTGYAVICHHLGLSRRSLEWFTLAKSFIKEGPDWKKSLFYSLLSDYWLSHGNGKDALEYANLAVEAGRSCNHSFVLSMALNQLGNAQTADEDIYHAQSAYDAALDLIEQYNRSQHIDTQNISLFKLHIELNQTRGQMTKRDIELDRDKMGRFYSTVTQMPSNYHTIHCTLSLAELILKNSILNDSYHLTVLANRLLNDAIMKSDDLKLTELAARGYLLSGQLFNTLGRIKEAQSLIHQSIFLSNHIYAPDLTFRGQWQLAQLYLMSNDYEKAIAMYHSAIETVQPIRQAFFNTYRLQKHIFMTWIKPLYLELSELYLTQSEQEKGAKQSETIFKARDIMEWLKKEELKDYFQDDCIAQKTVSHGVTDQMPNTAILYPIIFKDHTALLLSFNNEIHYVSVPVSGTTISRASRIFRETLEEMETPFEEASQLYNWLIQPIADILFNQNIHTLIVVPDGALRLIPFSALYDDNSESYLIEHYAIVTIVGMGMTDTEDVSNQNIQVLIGGISEAMMGFDPLPNVAKELNAVNQIMGGRILQDNLCTIEEIADELKKPQYAIVHMATHGVFGGTPDETFLLAHEEKITMNRLESLIDINKLHAGKVHLLTLSACQTALGNERAAFGLAGVAIKAGVKSAMATLWSVDDHATFLIIKSFYEFLKTQPISKAQALQMAQKKLIQHDIYNHPMFWGPFLLIGNWL